MVLLTKVGVSHGFHSLKIRIKTLSSINCIPLLLFVIRYDVCWSLSQVCWWAIVSIVELININLIAIMFEASNM